VNPGEMSLRRFIDVNSGHDSIVLTIHYHPLANE
jgi:hypothetical protein